MARTKGVNSDYLFNDDTQAIEEQVPFPKQLFMKIFLCPHNMPSHIEPPVLRDDKKLRCEGEDATCPGGGGHVLLSLHQSEGIKLVAGNQAPGISLIADDGARLDVKQDGTLRLAPSATGRVEVPGTLVVQRADGIQVLLSISDHEIAVGVEGGAQVVLKQGGDIDLKTRNQTGTVTVYGNLVVTGELNAAKVAQK